ncbi:Hsp33 family molecular chaperone HslO [Hydrogenovibrio kuenenii]|uniref:Hsp33 family molecular chaperone HslO n=1 Tax=Hydrogenovibrio kuenenii TaxID=63658 RepID=UPI0004645DDF|nr:Hsp33 family molecular chaperone HslO [Hydrogenovibrio kuenenii]
MNTIKRFLFKDLDIRGQHIQLDDVWQQMIEDRHYTPALTEVLGELTALTVMMANGLKHPGKVVIQIQGEGPVNLLVVEASHDLQIRGVAKTNRALSNETTLDELLGNGQILMTLENTLTDSLFQSYVDREGLTVTEAFETFLTQSEQLPSKLWLAASEKGIGGVLVQQMPASADKDEADIDGDAWNRVTTLADTLKSEELVSLDSETLLHRLFHEEVIELFEAKAVEYNCPKDPARIEDMIRSLGEEEARKLLEEQGEIVVHNEMCNFHLRLNKEDIDRIFDKTQH